MATLLLKKSYQLSNLKEVTFKDLWGSRGVFTTMRMVGKPPKLLLLKPHIENLIKSTKKYGIIKKNLKDIIKDLINKRENDSKPLKGELVLILEGYNKKNEIDYKKLSLNIKDKLKTCSLRDAVSKIVIETALPKNLVYNQAMKIKKNN